MNDCANTWYLKCRKAHTNSSNGLCGTQAEGRVTNVCLGCSFPFSYVFVLVWGWCVLATSIFVTSMCVLVCACVGVGGMVF